MSVVSLLLIQFMHYGTNLHKCLQDAIEYNLKLEEKKNRIDKDSKEESKNDNLKVAVKIVDTPKEFFGKYQDSPFYEWIDVESKEGGKRRLIFTGTIDMSRPFIVPSDSLLFPPGILYSVTQDDKVISK